MTRFTPKRTLAVAAAGLVLAAGGGAALAASSDSAPSPSSFWEAVAKHLGISSERLQDATKAAALEQVDAAVEAGRLTEEQAEELRSRIESSEWPAFGGFFHRGMHGPFGGKLEAAAEYLDLTEAELREKLEGGQSLADVARAEGKSVDGLKQAMLDQAKERLDEAVSAGRLTRAQADEILERLESHIDDIVNGTFERRREFHFFGPSGAPPAVAPAWGVPA